MYITQNKRNTQIRNQYNEDDEPTMRYKDEKQEYWSLNQNKSVFESAYPGGINTAESVFDRKAIFKTNF